MGEKIIPHPETRGAVVRGGAEAAKQGNTSCDLTLDTGAKVGAKKQFSTHTRLELACQATLFLQAQKREEANLKQDQRQRQEQRRLWLAQRRVEPKEYFHVPSVVVDAVELHPGSDLAGVEAAQAVTSKRAHNILDAHGGDSPNVHTEDPAHTGAGGGRPRAAPGQPGAASRRLGATPGGGGRDRGAPRTQEAMNPRLFTNTRGLLNEDETPEAINMSLDSPKSPKEAGAAARTLPNPTYKPEEEADMPLDQAKT